MSNSKISVIVSAYNTEKYIEKCIESILNQTYKNIEVIIVDDCSTDSTLKIIKKLEKNDNRIKIIENKQNMGLSYSRNIALENSTGDYIGYIDSDDYIEENYYEELLNTILENKADISVCDMKLIYEDTEMEFRTVCGSSTDKIDFINNGLAASACNKLFKKEVIRMYKFAEGKINEDLAVILPIVINNKTVYNPNVFYNYIQRNSSIQNSEITDKRFDIFYGVSQTLKRISKDENYEKYKDAIVYQQLLGLLLYVLPKEKSILKRRKWFSKFSKLIKPYKIDKNPYLKEFITNQGKKHQIYYKLLIKLNLLGLNILASLLVSVYNILRKILVNKIMPDKISIDDIIDLAKKQNSLEKNIKTISVVIPNYNYKRFLYQRIYSILSQTIKIDEIIILDDCSTDDSRKLIDEIVENLKPYVNIKKIYNEENSGSAFKQWEKGFKNATMDYVWIAEADDYCDSKFLEKIMNPVIKNDDVVISYSDTAFINTFGDVIIRTIKNEIDIMKTGHWDKNFVNDGVYEFNNYSFLNCTIANVSSAIIKNDNYDEFFKLSGKYKQAGDWLFYVNVMRKGKIAYYDKPLNYYRLHGDNVSSVTKKEAHIKEIKEIHKYYDDKFGLDEHQKEEIQKRYEFLKKVWMLK